jgi:Secretion system C-terminal sorting domain
MKTVTTLAIFLCLSLSTQAQAVALPYMQDFETATFPPTGCQFFGSQASPTWMRSASVGGFSASSACMYFDNFTTDLTGNYFGIRMQSTNFSGVNTPTISFDVAYSRFDASRSDRLGLWYSTNGTSGWINLTNYQNSTLTTAPDQTTLFSPDSTQWITKTYSMPSLAGAPFIRLAFENNSDHGNIIYVDNVHIYDSNPTDVANAAIASPYTVFPNPAVGEIFITENESFNQCQVTAVDLSGREFELPLCEKITANKFRADVHSLVPGIYILKIATEKGSFQHRVSIHD